MTIDIAKMLAEVDEEAKQQEALMFGYGMGSQELPEIKAVNGLPLGEDLHNLIALLQAEPMMLAPLYNAAIEMKARLDYAKLTALYTPEQIEAMRASLGEEQ